MKSRLARRFGFVALRSVLAGSLSVILTPAFPAGALSPANPARIAAARESGGLPPSESCAAAVDEELAARGNLLDPAFRLVRDAVEKDEVPGAIALVTRGGRILRHEAFGWSDPANRVPFTTNTLCWIASITKPVTVAAAMTLVDQGKLALEDPVEKYLPEFREQKDTNGTHHVVTIRQLMAHTSGLVPNPPTRRSGWPMGGPLDDFWLQQNLPEIVQTIARSHLRFKPGGKVEYSNSALFVLGRVIEVISGQPYAAYVKEKILEPLRMGDTHYAPPATAAGRVSPIFAERDDQRTAIFRFNPQLKISNAAPDGGLFSYPGEMAKFAQMFLDRDGRVLSKDAVGQMLKEQAAGRGLGWALEDGLFLHEGSSGTLAWGDPKTGVVGSLFLQFRDQKDASGRLRTQFRQAVQKAFAEPAKAPSKPAAARPPTPPVELAEFFAPPARYRSDFGSFRSPLEFADGTRVQTPADWQRRRAEILSTWHKTMGAWPPLIEKPRVEVASTTRRENITQQHLRIEIALGGELVDALLLIPDDTAPARKRPAVLVLYYDAETGVGLGVPLRDYGWQLAKRGFVVLSVGKPNARVDLTTTTKPRTEPYLGPAGKPVRVQPLSALAYAAANAHTVLAQRPEVDAGRIGIVGHSFGGKWAMFAACLYDKFACAVWSDPGIVFDERDRRKENPGGSVNYFDMWYLGFGLGNVADPKNAGPFRKLPSEGQPRTGAYRALVEGGHDLVELHALMAPRPFLVSGGTADLPERWPALNHAIAVNQLLGHDRRVAMTSRDGHSPTEPANEQVYCFFEWSLNEPK